MRIRLGTLAPCLLALACVCLDLHAQMGPPTSGDITVRLTDGLDSAVQRVGQVSAGTVMKSTTPAVSPRTVAGVQLVADPSGGFAVQLVRLAVNGQLVRTASSAAVLGGGFAQTMKEKARGPGAPQDAVSGSRVFLPEGTDVRFTLTTPPPQAAPPAHIARVSPAPRVPPAPAHPASTVVDLSPAAPGYPPLHASRPANDGCWWVPFVSQKYGLEMPVQRCAKATENFLYGENETGITEQYQNPPLRPPDVIFSVHTKPADQPIEAAIKQQFFRRLSTAAARANCHAKRDAQAVGKWDSYSVDATGPYSKLKKFHSDEAGGEMPCHGLQDSDVAIYFLYQPEESKTKFLFFEGQSDLITILSYDEESIRFRQEP